VLRCVVAKADVPGAVLARMEGTRALDGRQEAEWDNYVISWTFHPDDGMDVIFQER
jgi:hypothetical protein